MADINFDCPECGHNLDVDERGAGMTVPCPECSKPIRIPAPSVARQSAMAIACPDCKQMLKISSALAGQQINCPSCGQPFEIPSAQQPLPLKPTAMPHPNRTPNPNPTPSAGTGIRQQAAYNTSKPQFSEDVRNISSSSNMWKMVFSIGIVVIVAVIIGFLFIDKREVKGSTFIVTQSGENIKLGLVSILSYKTEALNKVAQPIVESYRSIYSNRTQTLKNLVYAGAEAERKFNELNLLSDTKNAEIALWAAKKTEDPKQYTTDQVEYLDQTIKELEKLQGEFNIIIDDKNAAQENYKQALQVILDADKALKSTRNECLTDIFDMLNKTQKPVADVKTDADGKFAFKVPKFGNYILTARASRQTGKDIENYYWMLRLEKIPKNRELFLSNDNLLAGSTGTSVFNLDSVLPESE